jgi:hypothetical protein
MANSEVVERSDEMVTAAFEAVRVACRLVFDPTATLPKLSFAGEILSFGLAAAVPVPVPATSIVRMGIDVLLMSVRVAPVYPVAVGAKMTGNSTLTQDSSVTGKGKLPNENALPSSDLERIVSA